MTHVVVSSHCCGSAGEVAYGIVPPEKYGIAEASHEGRGQCSLGDERDCGMNWRGSMYLESGVWYDFGKHLSHVTFPISNLPNLAEFVFLGSRSDQSFELAEAEDQL